MQISPSRTFGNCGGTYSPDRFKNSDGIRTLVKKLRLCQSDRGRSRTRVECRPAGTGGSSRDAWRTMFRRLFFGKRIGTVLKGYGTVTKWRHGDAPSVRRPKPQPFDLVSSYFPRSVTSLLMRSWSVCVTLFLICS